MLKKILLLTYYWPPGGGSGVQRWMYFCKYLPEFGIEPFVVTVSEKKASYKFIDKSLNEKVNNIKVFKTNTLEPLKLYSKVLSGNFTDAIPQGFAGEKSPGIFQKASRFIRGNFFIPDARLGWNHFAYRKAKQIIKSENISFVITTGPPHSTHLIGLKLKERYNLKWLTDFRDPWTEVYYNKLLFRTKIARMTDERLEKKVLQNCNAALTIGPSMKKLLSKKASGADNKFYSIYNGYDEESFKGLRSEKDTEHFTICHIGILSESQPITSFLEAMKKMFQDNPEANGMIKLKMVGKVSASIIHEINQMLPQLRLEVVEYVPHKNALQQMLNGDLLLNSFAEMKNSELLVSGKLMEYLASGNPIICLGNPESDAAELLRQFEYAKVISRNNVLDIYKYIERIFSRWRQNLETKNSIVNIRQYSRYEATRQLAGIIHNLAE